jgi:uncharacterized protein YkwD
MSRPARLLATMVVSTLTLTGCGGASGGSASVPSKADAPVQMAQSGVTDGRLGPAVRATDSEALRELARGGRPDPSEPRRSSSREDGIGAGDSCPDVDLMPDTGNLGKVEAATFCLLNGVRADDGLRPLQPNAALAQAARAHSVDMVAHSYFAHEGRNGSQVKDRIGATGYLPKNSTWTIGENLAWGTGALATPKAIVNAWMNSKGHRENILKADYREIGFGVVTGNPAATNGAGATFATEFGLRGDAGAAPLASTTTLPAPKGSRRAAARRPASRKAQRARRARAAKRASAKRASARSAARS